MTPSHSVLIYSDAKSMKKVQIDVMTLAAAWSINPTMLEDEPASPRLGVIGSLTLPDSAQEKKKKSGLRLPWFR